MNCKHRKVLPLLVPTNREAGLNVFDLKFFTKFTLPSSLGV